VLLEPGIWQVPRGRRGAAYIVVPGLLTRAPGYALLRGSFVSRNAAEAIERMDHFLTDPLLPSDVREALMDQIGRKEVPMSDDELDALDETFRALPPSPYRDHLIRCAKRQGRKEGRQEGRQEGQEALLNVAANLMTPSEVASLATRSLGEIAAAIAARVSALAGQQRQA
jgi:hypothetical protein